MFSAIILTHNEEQNIERALASVSFCDEVIVIDNNSTDTTVSLAKKNGATVYSRDLNGDFSAQRNYAMEKAQGDWVLFVDADEEVSPELRGEIISVINTEKGDQNITAYRIRRRDIFWGEELRHGEVGNASQQGIIRLVKNCSGTWKGSVHESFHPDGEVGTLSHTLLHYPHPTMSEFLADINEYSTIRARELYAAGVRPFIPNAVLFPLGKFVWTYVLRSGFRDGAQGFVYAFMMSFHSFLVRAKLFQYHNLQNSY